MTRATGCLEPETPFCGIKIVNGKSTLDWNFSSGDYTSSQGKLKNTMAGSGNTSRIWPLSRPVFWVLRSGNAVLTSNYNHGACLKIESGPAAVDFGGGQGGEARASPRRADCLRAAHVNSGQLIGRGLGSQMTEPTQANAKRRAGGLL